MIYSKTICVAKDASLIPVFKNGKPMHSRYNPSAESLPRQEFSGCLIVAGIGAGFHIKNALLQNDRICLLVAVEANSESLEFCKQFDAVKEIEAQANVVLCDAYTLEKTLCESYIPALHKNITLVFQRAWESENLQAARQINAATKRALDRLSADFSVQAHFGKLWHTNILLNLSFISKTTTKAQIEGAVLHSPPPFPIEKTAAIVAAGPSLDGCIEQIKAGSESGSLFVVAADTTFGTLQKNGITADAVVSIDAQQVSSRHFLCTPNSSKTLFVFDLCTNPAIVRFVASKNNTVLFVRTGHPLSSLANKMLAIPQVDAGGGTVTIAAADWAKNVGFRHLKFFGADFAYLNGKPYAKGTYLDAQFYGNASRTQTGERSFCALMFRCNLKKVAGKKDAFTTEVLERYSASLAEWTKRNAFSLHDGVWIREDSAPLANNIAHPANTSPFNFQRFMEMLLCEIEELLSGDEHTLSERILKNEVAVALLPYFAYLKESSLSECLKLAYRQTVRYNATL